MKAQAQNTFIGPVLPKVKVKAKKPALVKEIKPAQEVKTVQEVKKIKPVKTVQEVKTAREVNDYSERNAKISKAQQGKPRYSIACYVGKVEYPSICKAMLMNGVEDDSKGINWRKIRTAFRHNKSATVNGVIFSPKPNK